MTFADSRGQTRYIGKIHKCKQPKQAKENNKNGMSTDHESLHGNLNMFLRFDRNKI